MPIKLIGRDYILAELEDVTVANKISGEETFPGAKLYVLLSYLTGEWLATYYLSANADPKTFDIYCPPQANESMAILCHDLDRTYPADIFDYVSLCPTEYGHSEVYDSLIFPKLLVSKFFGTKRQGTFANFDYTFTQQNLLHANPTIKSVARGADLDAEFKDVSDITIPRTSFVGLHEGVVVNDDDFALKFNQDVVAPDTIVYPPGEDIFPGYTCLSHIGYPHDDTEPNLVEFVSGNRLQGYSPRARHPYARNHWGQKLLGPVSEFDRLNTGTTLDPASPKSIVISGINPIQENINKDFALVFQARPDGSTYYKVEVNWYYNRLRIYNGTSYTETYFETYFDTARHIHLVLIPTSSGTRIYFYNKYYFNAKGLPASNLGEPLYFLSSEGGQVGDQNFRLGDMYVFDGEIDGGAEVDNEVIRLVIENFVPSEKFNISTANSGRVSESLDEKSAFDLGSQIEYDCFFPLSNHWANILENHGALQPDTVTSVTRSAINFTGNGAFYGENTVDVANNDIFCRFRPTHINAGTLQVIYKNGDATDGVALAFDASGDFVLYGAVSGTVTTATIANSNFVNGNVYVAKWDGTTLTIYDETLDVITSVTETVAMANGTLPESIGGVYDESPASGTASPGEYFQGDILDIDVAERGTGDIDFSIEPKIALELGETGYQLYGEVKSFDPSSGFVELFAAMPEVVPGVTYQVRSYAKHDNKANFNFIGWDGSFAASQVWDKYFDPVDVNSPPFTSTITRSASWDNLMAQSLAGALAEEKEIGVPIEEFLGVDYLVAEINPEKIDIALTDMPVKVLLDNSVVVNDDFTGNDGDFPNPKLWIRGKSVSTEAPLLDTYFRIFGNELRTTSSSAVEDSWYSVTTAYKLEKVGDIIDVQVDYNVYGGSTSLIYPLIGLFLEFGDKDTGQYVNARVNKRRWANRNIFSINVIEGTTQTADPYYDGNVVPGKLRIRLEGSKLSLFIWNGRWEWNGNTSGYVHQIGAGYIDVINSPVTVSLDYGMAAGTFDAAFDNFQVNVGSPIFDSDFWKNYCLTTFEGEDNSLADTDFWRIRNYDNPNYVRLQDNAVRTTKTESSGIEYPDIVSLFKLDGEVDFQIDWEVHSWSMPSSNEHRVQLYFAWYDSLGERTYGYLFISHESGGSKKYKLYVYKDGTQLYTTNYATSDTSGKFKITTSGNTITFFVWSNGQWEWNGNTAGHSYTVTSGITQGPLYAQYAVYTADAPIDASFSNFVINAGEVVWPTVYEPWVKQEFIGQNGVVPVPEFIDFSEIGVGTTTYEIQDNKLHLNVTSSEEYNFFLNHNFDLPESFEILVKFDVNSSNRNRLIFHLKTDIYNILLSRYCHDGAIFKYHFGVYDYSWAQVGNDYEFTYEEDVAGIRLQYDNLTKTYTVYGWNENQEQWEWDGDTKGLSWKDEVSVATERCFFVVKRRGDQQSGSVDVYVHSYEVFIGRQAPEVLRNSNAPAVFDYLSYFPDKEYRLNYLKKRIGFCTTQLLNTELLDWYREGSRDLLSMFVKVPELDPAEITKVYLLFGDEYKEAAESYGSLTGLTGSTEAQAVWNNNFKAVYNLYNAAAFLDSTSNEIHLTPYGSLTDKEPGPDGLAFVADNDDYLASDLTDFSDIETGYILSAYTAWGDWGSAWDACSIIGFAFGHPALGRHLNTNYYTISVGADALQSTTAINSTTELATVSFDGVDARLWLNDNLDPTVNQVTIADLSNVQLFLGGSILSGVHNSNQVMQHYFLYKDVSNIAAYQKFMTASVKGDLFSFTDVVSFGKELDGWENSKPALFEIISEEAEPVYNFPVYFKIQSDEFIRELKRSHRITGTSLASYKFGFLRDGISDFRHPSFATGTGDLKKPKESFSFYPDGDRYGFKLDSSIREVLANTFLTVRLKFYVSAFQSQNHILLGSDRKYDEIQVGLNHNYYRIEIYSGYGNASYYNTLLSPNYAINARSINTLVYSRNLSTKHHILWLNGYRIAEGDFSYNVTASTRSLYLGVPDGYDLDYHTQNVWDVGMSKTYIDKDEDAQKLDLFDSNFVAYKQDFSVLSILENFQDFPMHLNDPIDSIQIQRTENNQSVCVALSCDALTYYIFKSSVWKAIVSKDDTIHGNTGVSTWHYLDSQNLWSELDDLENATMMALRVTTNRMTAAQTVALTDTTLASRPNASIGQINFVVGLMTTRNDEIPEFESIGVNNKKYTLGEVIDLAPYDGVIQGSKITWSYLGNMSAVTVYVILTGQASWTEVAINGQEIPGITAGMSTTGKKLQVRIVQDLSIESNPTDVGVDVQIW